MTGEIPDTQNGIIAKSDPGAPPRDGWRILAELDFQGNREATIRSLRTARISTVCAAWLLWQNKERGLWKEQYSSWEGYIRDLDVTRRYVYRLVSLADWWFGVRGVQPETIQDIDHHNLHAVALLDREQSQDRLRASAQARTPQEWIEFARESSRADVLAEFTGEEPDGTKGAQPDMEIREDRYGPWTSLVRQMGCLACGERPSDPHHFPTQAAGGREFQDVTIPLCRRHHSEAADQPARFFAEHRLEICRAYYQMGRFHESQKESDPWPLEGAAKSWQCPMGHPLEKGVSPLILPPSPKPSFLINTNTPKEKPISLKPISRTREEARYFCLTKAIEHWNGWASREMPGSREGRRLRVFARIVGRDSAGAKAIKARLEESDLESVNRVTDMIAYARLHGCLFWDSEEGDRYAVASTVFRKLHWERRLADAEDFERDPRSILRKGRKTKAAEYRELGGRDGDGERGSDPGF